MLPSWLPSPASCGGVRIAGTGRGRTASGDRRAPGDDSEVHRRRRVALSGGAQERVQLEARVAPCGDDGAHRGARACGAGPLRSAGADEARWGKPVRYELTEAGRSAYREFPAGRWDPRKPAGGFCYATPEVDSIIRYTEPAEGAGQVQTEVTYSYRLRDVAAWAGDAGFLRLYPEIERELGPGAPRQAQAILVRASDAWRVAARP